MKITEHYKLHKPDQDDFYDVDVLNENMDKIDTVLKETQTAVSNPAEQAPVFTPAETRSSLVSGEKLGTLMGKIAKWLTDLKDSAFATIANNCTTTEEGSVLDARQGQVLQGEVDEINSNLNALKKSVADGKSAIASAITGKGVSTAADAAFSVMAGNIRNIVTTKAPTLIWYGHAYQKISATVNVTNGKHYLIVYSGAPTVAGRGWHNGNYTLTGAVTVAELARRNEGNSNGIYVTTLILYVVATSSQLYFNKSWNAYSDGLDGNVGLSILQLD